MANLEGSHLFLFLCCLGEVSKMPQAPDISMGAVSTALNQDAFPTLKLQ